ncbi:uncharacterized protein [Haliotis asinina]|uniref:uncharacterized protein isoform X1 n=1 Tax=Haliotis asinina TaxID=109174 RepID=UPI003532442B
MRRPRFKFLLGIVLVFLCHCGVHAVDLDESLEGHDVADISDFIDLDDPFYAHETSSEVKGQTTTSVNIDALVTEKTTPVAVSGGNDVISDDDDDLELSGAGSGSGMDTDLSAHQLNITTFPIPEGEGVKLSAEATTAESSKLTSSKPSTSSTSTTSSTTTTKPITESTTQDEDARTTVREFPETTSLLPTSAMVDDNEDEDERDDGAADDSMVDWAIREGGDEDGDEALYETTSLRPSTMPTTTKVVVPTEKMKDIPALLDIIQEAGAGDGSPCDDVTCLYGGICKADGDSVACACSINCTGRATRPICGSDGQWYRNRCEMQLQACQSQDNITPDHNKKCQDSHGGAPLCPEKNAKAKWGSWSPWVASGDVDIRFRSCDIDGNSLGKMVSCRGPRVEVRSCNIRDQGSCRSWNGSTNGKFSYRCDGVDVRDVQNAEMTFGPAANGGDFCRYSLYDLKRRKIVFSSFNLSQVVSKGHLRRWCSKQEAFLVSHTPLHVCKRHLQDICKSSRKCKGSKLARRQRNLGDYTHSCWKDFILGNRIPSGISDIHSTFSFLCQRFAPDSKWGKVFGHKTAYYGTIFDTARRIPVVSLAKVTQLGEDTWPKTDFMIERGLIDEPMTFSWLLKRERGLATMSDAMKCNTDWDCDLGMKQALPVDYDMSGYRIAHLMWPELVGADVDAKLSTFTLTNTAPMHPSLYSAWRHAVAEIRSYAINHCKIPIDVAPMTGPSRPEMYIASGAVPSKDPEITIGNDVHVPDLFWTAVCCFRDDKVQSFSVYARNIGDDPVIVAPVLRLESILQDMYKVRKRDVNLRIFPAGEGSCAELRNDVSRSISL